MVEIKTEEDAKPYGSQGSPTPKAYGVEDNFEGIQEDVIKVLYRTKRQSYDVARTSATVVAEDATALARSHVEDSFLTDQKNTGQECVFVMKQGRLFYGIIKEYDDKVITVQARSDDATLIPYPKDILLYRTELSTIYCERPNDV